MSSAAGPRVPLRTGSWALRPLPRSLSSKVLPLLSVICAAALSVWARVRASAPERHVSRLNKGGLHGPCAEIKAPDRLLTGKDFRAAAYLSPRLKRRCAIGRG